MGKNLPINFRRIFALLLVLVAFSAYKIGESSSFAISRNIDIFASLFKEVNTYYIEDIDPDELAETGINAMLESLDPYTNYIPAEKMERYTKLTTGEYFGIGAKIEEIAGKKMITMPMRGYSAHKSGLQIGDELVAIDGNYVVDKSIEYINKLLKDADKTTVKFKIQKYGTGKIEEVSLQKSVVKIKNVPFYGKIDDNTGYIKLSEFTYGASDEVKKALIALKAQGINSLVLDLRDNPGGLLNEAIDVSNLFIEKGKEVVRTQGKIVEWNKSYKSLNSPVDIHIPLAVLLNENSASAAEIVAGVLQDYDRAVLVGQKSFGKGLVQATRTLSHNAKLKITTAKYFIPSGRCIQSIDYDWDNNTSHNKSFATANGRKVYDGQGIMPDVSVKEVESSALYQTLVDEGLIFEYANWYGFRNLKSAPSNAGKFYLSDEDFQHFVDWVKSKKLDYQTNLEKSLAVFESAIEKSKSSAAIQKSLQDIKAELDKLKQREMSEYGPQIKNLLEEEIAARFYLQDGIYQLSLRHDYEILKAARVLHNNAGYHSILGISIRL
jgi:carboxyl-terminal processing protease